VGKTLLMFSIVDNVTLVLDLLEDFLEYNFPVIPRGKIKYRPVVPDNIKYWQVLEDDKRVERFLQMSDEFANANIDDECLCEEDEDATAFNNNDPF
jgi:hypothetical protein